MRPLADWLEWARVLDVIYQEELGRSAFSDPEAFVNWTWHWAQGRSAEWVCDRIRESKEWRERRAVVGAGVPVPPVAVPPLAARVIKVADAGEGPWHPRMYSYWSNAWVAPDGTVHVFAGHADGRARFFTVHPDGVVVANGARLPQYPGTTEGWSWDRDGRIHLLDGPRLRSVEPYSGDDWVVFDISDTHPGCRLWQSHSRGDWHCATVERITDSGPYERLGTIVVGPDDIREFIAAEGRLDESQVTDTGWLIIKEERERGGRWRLDSRIVDGYNTGDQYWLLDEEGAVGHSDCDGALLVGEDDQAGACVLWDLSLHTRTVLFRTWNMGHVSLRAWRCLLSDHEKIALVALDGSGVTELVRHGVAAADYDSQVRANLDPTGRVACYMAGGDVFLVVIGDVAS